MNDILNNYKKQFKEFANDLNDKDSRKKQIPNLLTLSRLFAPLFIIPCAFVGNYPLCLLFIAIFSFTDLLDGYIARKYNFTSELGRDLDAVADKTFGLTLITSLISKNPLYILTLVLEAGIASINIVRKFKNKDPRSDIIGKVKMTVLYLAIMFGFGSIYLDIPINIINGSLFITSSLQFLTAGVYLGQDRKIEKIEENNKYYVDNLENESKKENNRESEINYYKELKKQIMMDEHHLDENTKCYTKKK